MFLLDRLFLGMSAIVALRIVITTSLLYILQNLLRVDLCLYLFWGEDLLDDAFLIYKVSGAKNANRSATACHFLTPATELLQ